ncbi:heterokaryon incompatibility protein-domain-containing protein [Hypoxylon crocopeplum]|nr:heterokaryon incompatibility protein-domain-containing protein [Hypoxylon crocopeplum]
MLSPTEIRILALLPPRPLCTEQAIIEVESYIVPISNPIDFEALSYVWGDVHGPASIMMDGKRINITKNLEAALQRIRLPDKKRKLWVDQLCINQDDDREKSIQIPLMRQIYTKANQCLIWLGEIRSDITISDAKSAIEIMQFIADFDHDRPTSSIPEGLSSEDRMLASMRALNTICVGENPWWHRVWTVQEVALSRNSHLLWGPLSISWNTIVRAFPAVQGAALPFNDLLRLHLDVLNKLFTQVNGLELTRNNAEWCFDAYFRWSFRRATNPLDKVYGLLGLFPSGTFPRVQCCNYQLRPSDLYAMFTIDLIEQGSSLHPIALRSLLGLPESTPGLPTWAYDIGVSAPQSQLRIDGDDYAWFLMEIYESYNACGGRGIDWTIFHFDESCNTLKLTGLMLDEIVLIGTRLQTNWPDAQDVPCSKMIERIKEWFQVAERHYKSQEWPESLAGPKLWPNSFWRGLVGNLIFHKDLDPVREVTSLDIEMVKAFVESGIENPSCYGVFATMCHRSMFITASGRLGFGPNHLNVGDEVWILDGGNVPFVLRKIVGSEVSSNGRLHVGPSYVDGIMNGEAVTDAATSDGRNTNSAIMNRPKF